MTRRSRRGHMLEDATNRVLDAVLKDYKRQDNPGFSDLDNEQPISIQIHVYLGDLRYLHIARKALPQ